MLLNISKKQNELIGKIGLVIVLLWPIFFVTSGIDVYDSGYYLSYYKHFFTPNVQPNIGLALSNLVGAWLYPVLPSAKFLAYRVLDWFMNALAWTLIYKCFKPYLQSIWLIPVLFIGSSFVRRYPMILSYNSFSFTFLIIAIYFLFKGLNKQKQTYIFISGLIIGFNVFFRIANALMAIFVLIPLWHGICGDDDDVFKNIKQAFKQSLVFMLAGFIGLGLGFAIVLLLYGPNLVFSNINAMFHMSKGDSSHGFSSMFNRILRELKQGENTISENLKVGIALVLASLSFGLLYKYAKPKLLRALLIIACVAGIGFSAWWVARRVDQSSAVYAIGYASILINAVSAVVFRLKSKHISTLNMLCLFIMLCVPLGTDNGLMQLNCVMPFVVLASLTSFNAISLLVNSDKLKNLKYYLRALISVFVAFIIAIGLKVALYNNLYEQSYGDTGYKNMNTSNNVAFLKHMKTDTKRSQALEQYNKAIHSEALEGYELVAVGNFPLAYSLSHHKPFFGDVWPDLEALSMQKFQNMLSSSVQSNSLPLVVVGDFNRINNLIKNVKLNYLLDFIDKNKYDVYINTDYFQIYKPKE